MPVVTGDQLSWPVVSAKTINVHRGDGSYVESLPGSATTWTATVPGDYFLVAATTEHWSSWPKSETVTVGSGNITTPNVTVANWLTSVGTDSPLAVGNSRAFLPSLIQIINAEPARLVNERFYQIYKEAQEALDGDGSSRFIAQSTSAVATTFACPAGGTYTLGAITIESYEGPANERQHEFNQCRIDGESFNGNLYTYNASFDDQSKPRLTSLPGAGPTQNPLQYVDKAGVSFTLDGFYEDSVFEDSDRLIWGGRFLWGGKIEIRKGDQSLLLDDFTVTAEYKTPQTDFNASGPYKVLRSFFTASGTITNGRTLQLKSIDPMRTLNDPEVYNQGLFVVTDASGGQLSMTATPTEPNGFTVRVDTEGRIDKYTVPWSDGYKFVILPTPTDW